jgi:hypothetical protein
MILSSGVLSGLAYGPSAIPNPNTMSRLSPAATILVKGKFAGFDELLPLRSPVAERYLNVKVLDARERVFDSLIVKKAPFVTDDEFISDVLMSSLK